MVLENGIIGGFCFLTFIFAYLSIHFKDSDSTFSQFASLIFFNMALLFANFVVYTMLLIVQQNIDIDYLNSPIMNISLLITVWVTVITFFAYFLLTLLNSLKAIYETVKGGYKKLW